MRDFRFSLDKRFFSVGYYEFLQTALNLHETVGGRASELPDVLTCEDKLVYDWSRVTVLTPEHEEALKQRKSYSLDKFDFSAWQRAIKTEVIIARPEIAETFMIVLSHDKNDPKRMRFYGQTIDIDTYDSVINRFRKSSLRYALGNGYSKSSLLNLARAIG